jgi:hypothetical protein
MRTAHVITASAFLALGVPLLVFANDAKHDVNSTVTFHPGEHKVKDLVVLLGHSTPETDATITLRSETTGKLSDVAVALLDVNGWRLYGKQGTLQRLDKLPAGELVTASWSLQGKEPKEFVVALDRLFGLFHTQPETPLFRARELPGSDVALVAATKERIERLLGLVEACAPVNVDRAITVYDVKHVNVTKLASVVDSVMELWRLQPLVGAKVTSRRPATIHLVPDPRSRKLIIEASSKAVLTEVERLIRALDRKPTTTFPAIRPESSETATGVTTSKSTTLLRVEPSSDGIRGHRVDISSGDIPIDEFLRFVADCEGLAVIREAGAGAGGKDTIHVAAPIKNADFEIVKAILDANGWALETRELDNGRKVIRVRRRASPKVSSFHPPRIIRATKDGKVTDSK